jgi:hypothetical protein
MRKRKKKIDVFEKEKEILEQTKEIAISAEKGNIEKPELTKHYSTLKEDFSRLLEETSLITSVSDRLQNKLNRANEKITNQNVQLQETIDMLTKARIGRKATTLVLILAIILFILSEAIIEPQIDGYVGNNFWFGLGFKGIIALMLKPIESLIERMMINRTVKQRERELKKLEE